jgi:hypothetical protein
MLRPFFQPYHHDKPQRSHRGAVGAFLLLTLVTGTFLYYFTHLDATRRVSTIPVVVASPIPLKPAPGQLLDIEAKQAFSEAQTQAVAHENYGTATLPAKSGITKITFRYRSSDVDGSIITEYGRAYIPTGSGEYPIFAFAPGTVGMGDQCAPSLENPKIANWGNYDSHMMMYASQGYAAVTTDYEGMRDPSRIHHYMNGELEGRALLDAVRALKNLPEAKGHLQDNQVIVGGYSQGGHASFWADTIAQSYSPDISIKGVVGFGPVMSVKESIGDVVYGSSLNWFGPYVLESYRDYYHADYGLERILQPRFIPNLTSDVLSHCIDTDISFWGHNPNAVYTPGFLASINSNTFAADYPELSRDLDKNSVGNEATSSAKLINQGRNDNVVLARQAESVMPGMCSASTGPVQLKLYNGTHYNTMVLSLNDTLAWMKQVDEGIRPATTCPPVQ